MTSRDVYLVCQLELEKEKIPVACFTVSEKEMEKGKIDMKWRILEAARADDKEKVRNVSTNQFKIVDSARYCLNIFEITIKPAP